MFEELVITLLGFISKRISYLPEPQSGSGGDWPLNHQGQSHQVDDKKARESLRR